MIEFIRIGILGIIRIDRFIQTEPNIFCNNNEQRIYKIIAFLNIFGLIWSFPFWIFYVVISLNNSNEESTIFFIVTFIYICLHILSSMPSISKLFRLISINKHLINNNLNNEHENQFGDSFLSSSIDVLSPQRMQSNDLLSPVSSRISIINPGTEEMEEEEDDPIMYTAPTNGDAKGPAIDFRKKPT